MGSTWVSGSKLEASSSSAGSNLCNSSSTTFGDPAGSRGGPGSATATCPAPGEVWPTCIYANRTATPIIGLKDNPPTSLPKYQPIIWTTDTSQSVGFLNAHLMVCSGLKLTQPDFSKQQNTTSLHGLWYQLHVLHWSSSSANTCGGEKAQKYLTLKVKYEASHVYQELSNLKWFHLGERSWNRVICQTLW